MRIQEVQQEISNQIKKATGVTVDVTNRGPGRWTVSGEGVSVNKAVNFLYVRKLMKEIGRDLDEEDALLYVYLEE